MKTQRIYAYIRYSVLNNQYILFISKTKNADKVEVSYLTTSEYKNFIALGIPRLGDV